MSAPEIQVSRLLDERGMSAFQIILLVWAVLLSLIDGYDIAAIAFAAPHLVASWGIPRSALGPVLSASNIGVLFGSAIFGWIGDRYGRKPALISADKKRADRPPSAPPSGTHPTGASVSRLGAMSR
jgi:AAHS family 4-hydroxybenzoate transporter-like MFS transporter